MLASTPCLPHRTAVILRDVEDFSISEAATLLGVSEAAFKMRLSCARGPTLRREERHDRAARSPRNPLSKWAGGGDLLRRQVVLDKEDGRGGGRGRSGASFALPSRFDGHYGRLPWSEVLAPAVRIAREGYAITELQHTLQERSRDDLLKGRASGARYFLRNGAEVFETGERFTQPQLARVLEVIARDGITPFYQGEIAEQIDQDMRDHEGFLRMEDLALIPWPVERRAPAAELPRLSREVDAAPRRRGGRSCWC